MSELTDFQNAQLRDVAREPRGDAARANPPLPREGERDAPDGPCDLGLLELVLTFLVFDLRWLWALVALALWPLGVYG